MHFLPPLSAWPLPTASGKDTTSRRVENVWERDKPENQHLETQCQESNVTSHQEEWAIYALASSLSQAPGNFNRVIQKSHHKNVTASFPNALTRTTRVGLKQSTQACLI